MQVNEVHRGMFEAVSKTVVVITPDGSNPEDEHGPLAVSFTLGGGVLKLRSNCPGDSSMCLIGLEAIRHVHDATGEALRQMTARAVVTTSS